MTEIDFSRVMKELRHDEWKRLDFGEENNSLNEIIIEDCQINDTSIQNIFIALKKNTSVTILNLSHNKLSHEGMEYIEDLLRQNKNLKYLYLSFNNITDTGAQHLAQVLQQNHTLSSLSLMGNKLTDAGAISLRKALYCNTRLLELNLTFNKQISEENLEHIQENLKDNKLFFELSIIFSQAARQAIKQFIFTALPTELLGEIILRVANKKTLSINKPWYIWIFRYQ